MALCDGRASCRVAPGTAGGRTVAAETASARDEAYRRDGDQP